MKKPPHILILGATSAIAQASARVWAGRGAHFLLAGRSVKKLEEVANDLRVRGASVAKIKSGDFFNEQFYQELLQEAAKELGEIDVFLLAWGSLGEQKDCEEDFSKAEKIIQDNYLSYVMALTHISKYLVQTKKGVLAVISSVAGERGRQSNYVYGSAKGALTVFLQGLRNRLASVGVPVITILPGFVDTPMTKSYPKNFLYAKAESVGKAIVSAVDARTDVVFLPWFWRYIMLVIKLIPEGIFKRLKL